jgi:hypothetical protein
MEKDVKKKEEGRKKEVEAAVGKKQLKDSRFKKTKFIHVAPWMTGAVIGFLAASLQKIASMTKPPAYGFCMACHTRDLINGIINFLSGAKILGTAPVIENPINIPVLTLVGVLLGSFVAALVSKEFRVTKGDSIVSLLKMFILGVLVMIFALILSACPIRAALRTAHGDLVALAGLISIGVGAIIATFLLERSVEV